MTLQSMYLNLRAIVLESDNAVTMPDGKKYGGVKKIFKINDKSTKRLYKMFL